MEHPTPKTQNPKLHKYLITGGCGFLGSNLASDVLKCGEELIILDNLSRIGSTENLSWLQGQGEFRFVHADIRNPNDVTHVISDVKPDVILINRKISAIPYSMRYLGRQEYRGLNSIGVDNAGNIE